MDIVYGMQITAGANIPFKGRLLKTQFIF